MFLTTIQGRYHNIDITVYNFYFLRNDIKETFSIGTKYLKAFHHTVSIGGITTGKVYKEI